MRPQTNRVVLAAVVLLLAGCGNDQTPDAQESPGTPTATATSTAPTTPESPPPTTRTPKTTPSDSPKPTPTNRRSVLAVSVDGLNAEAVLQLGAARAPAFFRLLEEGASTLNARTAVEQTVTLPNHTGMFTGRRIDADQGGHGVTWNEEVPGSVVPGQGNGAESVFDVVHEADGGTALFTSKDKFAIFGRSWDDAIDEFEIVLDNDAIVDDVQADLTANKRRLTFLHLALPDNVGHESGWMSSAYLDAVRHTDELVGELIGTVESTPRLQRRLVVVLTADHGGVARARDHADATAYANFRVPFVVWGRDVTPGDLYELNPDYRDPGTARPSYDGPQPVRNADLANLVTDLLGLGPVPGSELNAAQDLDVVSP